MSLYRVFSVVVISACASSGQLGVDPQAPSPHARISLAPVSDGTHQVLPQALEPELPSADRLGRAIELRLGTEASVGVRLCVTPAGHVASVKLEQSSTMELFDKAVLDDVQDWRFAAQPGPETLHTCEIATIVYRLPR